MSSFLGTRFCRAARLLLLAALVVLSLGATGWAAEEGAAERLSVWDAARRVLDHDLDAQIAKLNLDSARITYEKSMAANLLTNSEYDRRAAEAALRSAEISFANQQADLAAGAVTSYLGLLVSELTVQIRDAQLEVAELNLEATRRKAEMGTASRLDLLDAQASVDTALLNARQARAQHQKNREAFAASIGLDVNALPALDPDPAIPTIAVTLDEAVEKALALSPTLVSARSNLELARLEQERAIAEGVAPLDARAAEIKVRRTELELRRAESSVRESVESAFDEVERARAALEVEEVQLTAAIERHQLLRQQFEAGLRTRTELINAEIQLAQAKQRRLEALSTYFRAVLALNKLIGASIDVMADAR